MLSNDFATQGGVWATYDDSPGDVGLENFTIARDLQPNGTLSALRLAQAAGFDGVVQAYMCIQNIYMLHDVLHVAPFPPQPWMAYITHPFSDLLNCGWQDIMLEHKRHHVATADVLHHGEFGWDPSEVQYFFQESAIGTPRAGWTTN